MDDDTVTTSVTVGRTPLWSVPLAVVSLLVPLLIIVAALVPSSWVASKLNTRLDEMQPAPYARVPASAQPVAERLSISAPFGQLPEQFPSDGSFNFVTITEPRQSALSWWIGRDEVAFQLLTEEDRFGFQTPDQRRVFSLESMRTAGQVAQYVALTRLGFDAQLLPGDVLIQEMVCLERADDGECLSTAPSDEILDPGDRLLVADGVRLESVDDLIAVLADRSPGDLLSVRVERRGSDPFEAEVELISVPDEPDRTIVGFIPFDTRRIELPFTVDIDTGSIGGPSAGLAFTLTLIDELSPGELTGSTQVAVTGTINLDGSVGAIGGLRQKASAVDQAGIEVFLVPAAQREDDIEAARAAAPDLQIIPVATLDEALEVLVDLGGDPIYP